LRLARLRINSILIVKLFNFHSKYRLGTSSTAFVFDVLSQENVDTGLIDLISAHCVTKGSNVGVSMARFLAIMGWELSAHDMYDLGLITHIVESEPHVSLMHSIGHTLSPNDDLKAQQSAVVDISSVNSLLDTMNVFTNEELTSTMDGIMDHASWDEIMLVNPSSLPGAGVSFLKRNVQLAEWASEIDHCFSVDSIDECKERLLILSENISWASDALSKLNVIPHSRVQEWFRITGMTTQNAKSEK